MGLRTANLSEKPLEEHLQIALGSMLPTSGSRVPGSVKALGSALESVRPGGTVIVVGLYAEEMCFSPTAAVRREISLLFSYSCNYADYQTTLDLLGRGRIDPEPLLSKYPLEDAPEAFEAVGKGQTVKAVLVP